jgi:hypothetical protein
MTSHLRLLHTRSILERRLFLKALGLGLAAPVALNLARSATAQPSGAPKRFFVMYFPHGIAPEHFNPRMTGPGNDPTQFALDMTNESTLAPLEAYKQHVNVYQGFQYPGSFGTHEGLLNILSGLNTGDTSTPRITLEHVIAQGLGVKPTILGACSHQTWGLDGHGMLFWDGTTPVDPEKNPAVAADKLFGTSAAAPSADQQLKNAMLELTITEIEALQTSVSGLTREHSKLQTHLDSVKTLKAGGGSGQSSCTTVPSLPTVERVRMESAGKMPDPGGGNDYFYMDENFRTLFQAQLEVVTQALICNASQVMGLMPMYATSELKFDFIDSTLPNGGSWTHHNGLSHIFYQGKDGVQHNSPITIDNAKPEARAVFGVAQRWFFEQLVSNVVSKLATTPDPAASDGSTVLDNTLIFVLSEIGDGANHTRASMLEHPQIPSYLPFITIGKAGGAIKTGQVLTVGELGDQTTSATLARPATDLYLTLAKAMGVDATFPATTGLVQGVLT